MTIEFIAGPNVEGLAISEAVRAGDFVFLSGLAGFGPDGEIVSGGVAAETDRIMLDVKDILQRASLRLSDIVKVNVYLREAKDAHEFNTAYAKYFPLSKPARTGTVADLLNGGLVELEVVAYGAKPEEQ
ncbi:RidA family protein [Mesorhizobium sp. 113-3-3]|uniref:RidA family protein n=1 Tax=Mesorhizobium sp. 113-3-3 TaxID=2744516 RepID=UPI0018EC62B1|nr:RidA family protein [Mesorhizobium sp. 113-3-3]BCG83881.1 translation initiation inhibitor [Mesorhizobium sp. 113-3-3]